MNRALASTVSLCLVLVAVGGGWIACPTAAAADAPRRETVSVAIPISGERFPAALVEIDALPTKPGDGYEAR